MTFNYLKDIYMTQTNPINFHQEAQAISPLLISIEEELAKSENRNLFHLVALRASQINQCAFCVKMHIREALEDGETQERIDRLIVWRHVSDFTEKEKVAFTWVEALTSLKNDGDNASLRSDLRQFFSEKELALLTAKVAMINLWNRIQVANH
ncbi:alkylhydroperoxidase AhpD family core domain-containing protein [Cohaesibacter gelatinilyticus]|uniref:Alkylhydroperoxidase AhpD family core domain-containing protein n=2 Tax=Cohaesibacter gelatinilyticus TaxID=372072 RepID=A0A285PI20_9HYPH|nr:alkylhydroperoxidase AhpD family core domain-containing protein [Cohaesibacter gelatinilyticus]